jgi:hypothetical protein
LEDIRVDRRIILICSLSDKMGAVDWSHLTRNKDWLWALENAVMKFGAPQIVRELLD